MSVIEGHQFEKNLYISNSYADFYLPTPCDTAVPNKHLGVFAIGDSCKSFTMHKCRLMASWCLWGAMVNFAKNLL